MTGTFRVWGATLHQTDMRGLLLGNLGPYFESFLRIAEFKRQNDSWSRLFKILNEQNT